MTIFVFKTTSKAMKKVKKVLVEALYFIIAFSSIFALGYMLGIKLLS